MKILLTGGSGDLGQVLIPQLEAQGHTPIIFDIQTPIKGGTHFIQGSLLKLAEIEAALAGVDVVIHIAAWHGIHESRGLKQPRDFWDLNVNGSYNLLEACVNQGVSKLVHISSSSVSKLSGVYGFTKRLAEQAMIQFKQEYGLDVVILRPRAFIPHWNREVYADFVEWAKRFWPGAVHIQDVAQAVLKSLDLLSGTSVGLQVFTIDRAPDFPDVSRADWDKGGQSSSFRAVYGEFEALVQQHGLDPSVKPNSQDISRAQDILGYQPEYGLKDLLLELQARDLNS